jgi:hypothetical protein
MEPSRLLHCGGRLVTVRGLRAPGPGAGGVRLGGGAVRRMSALAHRDCGGTDDTVTE